MSPFDKEIWARTIVMEAAGEGREGMRAVGHAIANRRDAGKWFSGRTIAGCCLIPFQFSCWNTADKNRLRVAELPEDDPTLNLARSLVDDILNGDEDPTDGATHYYSTDLSRTPEWAKAGDFTVQIGKHRFFANVP